MFDLAEIMRSEHPKDEVFAMGSGKFSAAIVGTLIIGVGNRTPINPFMIYSASGITEWTVEERVKEYFENKIRDIHNKENEKVDKK